MDDAGREDVSEASGWRREGRREVQQARGSRYLE